MKLKQILSNINQMEKSKFITNIDKICTDAAKSNPELAQVIKSLDGQFKSASGSEIAHLYSAVKNFFKESVRESLSTNSAQIRLLVNIVSRDGNCVARISWIESLYAKEWKVLQKFSKDISEEIFNTSSPSERSRALSIYYKCMKVAYDNNTRTNRDPKISDEQRVILNVLANNLDLTNDECSAIEHLINPTPKSGVIDALNTLRDIGVLFISRKRQEIYVPDEIVSLLNEILGKDLADKHTLRLLRTFSDPELSNILKAHGRRVRGVSRIEKIHTIIHSGIKATDFLSRDMHAPDDNQNQRKDRLKRLISDLEIETNRLGSTLEERVGLIISSLSSSTEREFESLSASGFKEMLSTLSAHFPTIIEVIKSQFELEENEIVDTEKLRALGITPHDILYLLSNEDIKNVRDSMVLPKRGNPRFSILKSFASATDKLIDNYDALARRDINHLKEVGLDVPESDLGLKFEEVTKTILEMLGLNVDEDVRKEINTSKDKADIVISLSDDDIIIGEAKTCKNGDFTKYSTTSRQVKSYVNRAEGIGKRVDQVLIVAPSFSNDFIESSEMDTEINISLLEAKGLKLILDAFRAKKNPNFTAKLLTKGGILKADLIAKKI